MYVHKYTLISIVLLTIPSFACGDAVIKVNAKNTLGPVNRNVFGQMLVGADDQYIWSTDQPNVRRRRTGDGIWDDKNNRPAPEPIKILKEMKPGVVRYPGGSTVKNHDWKVTVGPIDKRGQNWHWGLMEYLRVCKEIGAEPQICLSSYKGGPEDQRDLVEFVNAPATKEYPWAMKRAEYGHPAPYNVKYFELGNEPYDGNRRVKPSKKWTSEGYIQWALKTIELIRSVDPSVKIGLPPWTDEQIRVLGPKVDFIVIHTYPVSYAGNQDLTKEEEDRIMRACMAEGEKYEARLREYHEKVKKLAGKDLPLAVTEMNVHIKGKNYRRSLAAGMMNVDLMLRMLKPENRVLLANHWQIFASWWGSIQMGRDGKCVVYAPVHCFTIVGRHLGDTLLDVDLKCDKVNFEGFTTTPPMQGKQYIPRHPLSDENLFAPKYCYRLPIVKKHYKITRSTSGVFDFTLKGLTKQNYPGVARIPVSDLKKAYRPGVPGVMYQLSFEALWQPRKNSGSATLGIGMMDGRGWDAAGSAIGIDGVTSAVGGWKKFKSFYKPLYDTPSLSILGRLLCGSTPVWGTLKIRNFAVRPWKNEVLPAHDELTVSSSLSADEKTLYVIVINRRTKEDVSARISLLNFNAKQAKYSEVNAPSAASVENTDSVVKDKEIQLKSKETITHTFPAHSITAIEFIAH